ncbi:MAG: hypothetical protein HN580_14300 [Deltaproteobacteria bacterium]|jgi:hypothetical protein|nr:hypothetical protein [Deltaproteobacteria bacterium]MBT4266122.1 hypothetical protein [Deltaproteobacteria bacterium]MBT4637449.1 hypothetical protein [Deltaproteobacteria bacterium]MBT6504909.1 hypothetical protein [Deltaproteobacteria bacterium]MBT6612116.1 hypothetical protein [Deltaproteobacteria bacterium]
MSYFEEKLPSNSHKRIQCKEYSVADAITVSSMNPKLVERFTSKFLEVIQTGQDIVNPKMEMTVHDRKSLVFKFALASIEADELNTEESYNVENCHHCGGSHEFRLSIVDFQKAAKSIIRNEPTEVLTEYRGQRLKITPMLGTHAEALERFENTLASLEKKHGEDSDEYQKVRADRDMYELLCQFETVNEDENKKDSSKQAEKDKAWLHSLPPKSLPELKNLIAVKQEEIKHGIDFRHTFYCPEAKDEKEGPVVVMLPFRLEDLISRI